MFIVVTPCQLLQLWMKIAVQSSIHCSLGYFLTLLLACAGEQRLLHGQNTIALSREAIESMQVLMVFYFHVRPWEIPKRLHQKRFFKTRTISSKDDNFLAGPDLLGLV